MSLRHYVERGEVPGYVSAIARPEGVEIEVAGTAARDTIFRIASLTKPITAAAAMILVDAGVLELDAPVERWLPELANRRVLRAIDAPLDDTVPARRAISVRDLLAFTLGWGITLAPPGTYPIERAMVELELGQGMPRPHVPPPPDEWLRRLATLPLIDHPGERWMYNTGSDVLGVLIARAARQPFDVFLHERLFAPLGMKDTAFVAPAVRLPPAYDGALQLLDPPDGDYSRPPAFPSGAGGLVATIDDFLAFARMLSERGGRVLSPRAVAARGRRDDTRSAHARAEIGRAVAAGLVRRPQLGLRHGRRARWPLRLGRRARNDLGEPTVRDPRAVHAARVHVASAAADLRRAPQSIVNAIVTGYAL
jgi:CubicO group peptidase (beta-lactamase class C family)